MIWQPLLAVVCASVFFGAGWFLRYSMKAGVGGATQLFASRLFDALSLRPPPPKPSPTPSAGPSPTTTATVAPSASATPPPRPRPKPPVETSLKNEVLALIPTLQELQKSDQAALRATVTKWPARPGAAEVIALGEQVDRLVYVKDPVRRGILYRLFALGTVMTEFKMDPNRQDEMERIAKGWDMPDVRKAFDRGGAAEVKKLAAGRPASFFIDLRREWPEFQVCRENLTALKEGKARPAPAGGAGPPDPKLPPMVECPSGKGVYEQRGKGVWACTLHQTLDQPFPEAARLQWYIEPVEEALKTSHLGAPGVEGALASLTEVLRLHPNHVWAVDAENEILAEAKAWQALKIHLDRYLPAKDPLNARWAYLMAKACHEQLDFDGAKKFAGRAQNSIYTAPPPNVARLQDFFLLKDRALEIYNAANDKSRPEEIQWRRDEDQPSQLCVRNLTDVRTAIGQFVKGYPGTHPDLAKLRDKKRLAAELLAKTPPGPKLDTIKAKAKLIDDRIAQVTADTGGKMLWKGLVKFLAGYQVNPCPAGGRYTFERHQFLDCAKHPNILGERLDWEGHPPPTPEEEVQLSRGLLKGALAGDPKRRACFDVQKAYVASRGAQGVQPGEITTSTKLPDGQPLTCPAGKIEAVATGATTARVRCSYHGSYEEYFEGFGELKEGN